MYEHAQVTCVISLYRCNPQLWAHAENFPEGGGAKPQTPKKVDNFPARQKNTFFDAALKTQKKTFAFLRRFRPNLRVFIASTKGASEMFRAFRRRAAFDVIFIKFQGEALSAPLPPCHMRAPMPTTHVRCARQTWQDCIFFCAQYVIRHLFTVLCFDCFRGTRGPL